MTQVAIQIDGRRVEVAAGTSVAAALWSAGVHRFRRSIGGAPRGPICAMGICFECRVTIDGEHHRRACMEICREDMEIEAADLRFARSDQPADCHPDRSDQLPDCHPDRSDRRERSGGIPPGRPSGGSGTAQPGSLDSGSLRSPPLEMTKRAQGHANLDAEVVVVGAGPAGIAAACRAAEAGANTLLLDENPAPGGQIWRRGTGGIPRQAATWIERLQRSGARIEHGVSVWDAYDRALLASRADQALQISWRQLIVATGARELFLPFPGWTLPGVLGLGGLQAMVKSGASVADQRIVVAGSGPLILPVAATLAQKGARLVAVAEQAPAADLRGFAASLWRTPGKWVQAANLRRRFASTRYRTGTWITAASGDGSISRATLTDGIRTWSLECDLLAASYGLVPSLELARLLGCELDGRAIRVDSEQRSSVDGVLCAGEVCGIGGADSALAEGQIAGLVAAGQPIDPALVAQRRGAREFARRLDRAFAPRRELAARLEEETLVCRCEDVPWGDLDPTWSMRQAKLYRRVGMGPCQGRVCGAALEHLHGWKPDTGRPPLQPVTAGQLARSPAK